MRKVLYAEEFISRPVTDDLQRPSYDMQSIHIEKIFSNWDPWGQGGLFNSKRQNNWSRWSEQWSTNIVPE